jgi:hypothetical protein
MITKFVIVFPRNKTLVNLNRSNILSVNIGNNTPAVNDIIITVVEFI